MAQKPLVDHGLLIIGTLLSHSVWHTTLSRTSLEEWSAHRRDLYLNTHSNHKRQTSVPPPGFEPRNPRKQAAADPHLRPCGHRDLPIS